MRLLSAPVLHQVQLRYDALRDVGTGRLVVLLADVVWVHPTWGDLPADDAWSAAERAGVQGVLRRWLLTQACRDAAAFPATVGVGVRLPGDLTVAETLAEDVADALAAGGLSPERLALCFPEQLLRHAPVLRAVHDAGVRLVLTDPGPGTHLGGLPTEVPLDAVVVSLGATGGPDHALRVLRGTSAAEVGGWVATVPADVETPDLPTRVGTLGLRAMTGPLLPSGLTAAEAAARLAPQPA
ncbi:EAL domain-containing protein [Modestobacter altitudinis]|uniref:EAL domain-containing protein n=1 Tax=Modestobacter altitudinis TaxID=2213158 RepID=UPI00110CEB37|nr:EAL domain-containing protein [Modestobacter altitudinis]